MTNQQQAGVLTDRELQVFLAIKNLARTKKKVPSHAELAKECGVDRTYITKIMPRLVSKGYVKRDKANKYSAPRSIQITNFRRSRKAKAQ